MAAPEQRAAEEREQREQGGERQDGAGHDWKHGLSPARGVLAAAFARYMGRRAGAPQVAPAAGRRISVMSVDDKPGATPPARELTPEALRALAEAAERRRLAEAAVAANPKEIKGRGGLDPVRYGDWEIKGLASDF